MYLSAPSIVQKIKCAGILTLALGQEMTNHGHTQRLNHFSSHFFLAWRSNLKAKAQDLEAFNGVPV